MGRKEGACLECGKPLVYLEAEKEMECIFCHKTVDSRASCEEGHFVCDECHGKKGIEIIMDYCSATPSRNPIEMMQELMEDPYIYMHGPEHHVMVGAVLLSAYKNSGGEIHLDQALEEMKARGTKYPGGSCGFWGCCGAAVSAGMFMSILTQATPLTVKSWRLSNQMTARVLEAIAQLGGPRCCKRNSFTAAKVAAAMVEEELGVKMELPETIQCNYFRENKECLRKRCPYFAPK